MKNISKRHLAMALGWLGGFALWTAAVRLIDVQPIGPLGSAVGLTAVNGLFHDWTGVHMALYTITDWLSLIPAGIVLGFAILGLVQWIKRKSLYKVDQSILVLGGCYVAVMAVYLLFERWVVNYRPVLIGGVLEASYPSSTTVLVLMVMTTAILQLRVRIKKTWLRKTVVVGMAAFAAFMVVGRLVSGVHWLTDIVGGVLLSAGMVELYVSLAE